MNENLLKLLNLLGERIRHCIFTKKYEDVSMIMNQLMIVTMTDTWDKAGKIAEDVWATQPIICKEQDDEAIVNSVTCHHYEQPCP
jgi:hypothetical protein